jgi:hypothetical protein
MINDPQEAKFSSTKTPSQSFTQTNPQQVKKVVSTYKPNQTGETKKEETDETKKDVNERYRAVVANATPEVSKSKNFHVVVKGDTVKYSFN